MKTNILKVDINRTLLNDEIENELSKYGEPLRWAVVAATEDKFTVEAVFLS